MIRERVAENVYVFTSELYASVNAGAVIGPEWSVIIDTLPFPEETLEIKSFIEIDLNSRVRYVLYTHYHADHTFGASWFPQAQVLGNARTRQLLDSQGRAGLWRAQQDTRDFEQVQIVLPDFVFDHGSVGIRIGNRTLKMVSLPGHSSDGAGVLLVEDKVLFAGDIMMPIPYLVDGDYEEMIDNLRRLPRMKLESLVQGHGDVILRGEVGTAVKENLQYLTCISKHVRKAGRRKHPLDILYDLELESCGKSRILMGGLAQELHQRNLQGLFHQLFPERVKEIQ